MSVRIINPGILSSSIPVSVSYENNLETIENKEIREKKEKLSTEIMTDFTRDKQEKMFLINKLLSINNLQEILKFQIELEKLKMG